MAQQEEKRFVFSWRWTSVIPIAVLGIVEAAVWLLTEDFPKWAKFQGVAQSLSTIILGLLFIVACTVKWNAVNCVRRGLGLLFIGVAVSPFVWPEKVVEIPPPVASCKDMAPRTLTTTLPRPQGGWIMDFGEMPPDILRVRVNTSTLVDWECNDDVQLALVAWLVDDTTDHMTDYHIEKSDLLFPVSEQMELQLQVREPFLRRAAPQHDVMLTLVALPARGITPSDWNEVTTVNQAVRNGGSVIADWGFPLWSKCPSKTACALSYRCFEIYAKSSAILGSNVSFPDFSILDRS